MTSPRATMCLGVLAWIVLPACGCGGNGTSGWIRIERPSASFQPVVLEEVEAYTRSPPDEDRPVEATIFVGWTRLRGDADRRGRSWSIIGLAEPADAPGLTRLVGLIGAAEGQAGSANAGDWVWRFFDSSDRGAESWVYEGRCNIQGRVRLRGRPGGENGPATRSDLDPSSTSRPDLIGPGEAIVTMCVKSGVSEKAYRKALRGMLDRLTVLQERDPDQAADTPFRRMVIRLRAMVKE